MLNQQVPGGHSLGLSVGATNLAATRDGHTSVIRPSEVTLQGQRLTGFVDRVGDPVPIVAPDGSHHRAELLLAEALGAVAQAVTEGMPVTDTAIAVPAHWRPSVVDTMRRTMRDGLPVVSDATSALTALSANPGLPTRGVVVLCDFGGSGSSITLANAVSNYAVVGETVRFADFSGEAIDQALLTHVVSGLGASQADPFGTAMVGSLTAMRDECRHAKEVLSAQTATAVAVDVPGHHTDVRVTRLELEDLMQAPITSFLAALDDTLERYGVPQASVSAVATVGGGARIPLITQRLSEHLRAPVVTTSHPQLTAAEGAALIARRGRVTEGTTILTPAPGLTAATIAIDASGPVGSLAWSDDDGGEDELPYAGYAPGVPPAAGRLSTRTPLRAQGARGCATSPTPTHSARPVRPVCRGRSHHRRRLRLHAVDGRHHPSRGCDDRRAFSSACGAGTFSRTAGAAGPPDHHRGGRARSTGHSAAAGARHAAPGGTACHHNHTAAATAYRHDDTPPTTPPPTTTTPPTSPPTTTTPPTSPPLSPPSSPPHHRLRLPRHRWNPGQSTRDRATVKAPSSAKPRSRKSLRSRRHSRFRSTRRSAERFS